MTSSRTPVLTYNEAMQDRKLRGNLHAFEQYLSPAEERYHRTGEVPSLVLPALVKLELSEYVENALAADRLGEARQVARIMAGKLDGIGRGKLAAKVGDCFSAGRFEIREHGTNSKPYSACGYSKLCPFHARSRTKRVLRRYLPHAILAADRYRLQLVTLTTKNVPAGELADEVKRIWRAWGQLRRRASWAPVAGAIANMETTWNPREETWNPHLHVIAAVEWGRDFAWARVQGDWNELTGALIVDFAPVTARGNDALAQVLKEVLKYPTKFGLSLERGALDKECRKGVGLTAFPLPRFGEWFETFHGARTMRSYGLFFGIPEDDLEPEDLGALLAVASWRDGSKGVDVSLIQVHKSTEALQRVAASAKGSRGKTGERGPPSWVSQTF